MALMRGALFSIGAIAGAAWLCAPAVAGQTGADRPVVLELFVSQNCGACPSANDALAELNATRPDILPLTYDVDYWDYLGWRDTLAHPDFTARQRAYADRFGQARVYTPQMVVDGREAGPGGDRPRIASDIKVCREAAANAPDLAVRREGTMAVIEIGGGTAPASGADVWIVAFDPGHMATEVGSGENQGKLFTVVNPVRSVAWVGEWTGSAERWTVRAPEAGAFAVLVQQDGAGPILTAAASH
jgi:hypothetical protein